MGSFIKIVLLSAIAVLAVNSFAGGNIAAGFVAVWAFITTIGILLAAEVFDDENKQHEKELSGYLQAFVNLKNEHLARKEETAKLAHRVKNLEAELKFHRNRQSKYDEVTRYVFTSHNGKYYMWDAAKKQIVQIVSKKLKVKSA